MPSIDVVVNTPIPSSPRVRQLEAMFDVPPSEMSQLHWQGELPIEESDWNVGLIVGPSGSGKSTIARHLFGEPVDFEWSGGAVIDDFARDFAMDEISSVCQAVGFNTIPSWRRPFRVLSTGERFRVDLARRLLELGDPIVVDEFTSVVDRQVAKIGSYAVQKYVRRRARRFIAVTCHYDVEEWLDPDWTLDVSTLDFRRRRLRCQRPEIECTVQPVDWEVWKLFAPFHYLTASLNRSARCYALLVDGQPAAFAGFVYRMKGGSAGYRVKDRRPIWGCSRLVTLPDWQGLGLAFVLIDALGSAMKTAGMRCRTYPAHPALVRSFDRSQRWALVQKPGVLRKQSEGNRHLGRHRKTPRAVRRGTNKGRPCGVFEYCGEAMERADAKRLLSAHWAI